MPLSTQPYKGTRDFYPEDMALRRAIFSRLRDVAERYGYREYDGPLLEPFELYAAKSGEEIINQQLYSFIDRGERKVAIRPEMTPTLARMVAARLQELPKPVRWFSLPNLWRYERPQKGRLREHWQLNIDVLGGDPVLADTEVLMLASDLLKAFGCEQHALIRVNHRSLSDSFFRDKLGLPPEKALQVTKAIDAREKIGEERYRSWLAEIGLGTTQTSKIDDFFKMDLTQVAKELPGVGAEKLQAVIKGLEEGGCSVPLRYDPTVMRGLDYYTGTVFEMYDSSPENRRALFGGGRYDDLIGLFGKEKLPGVGFGLGDVTLRDFLETHSCLPQTPIPADVFVTMPSVELRSRCDSIALTLRNSGLRTLTPLSAGGFSSQLKQASRLGARVCVLLGESELQANQVALKDLKNGNQITVPIHNLAQTIKNILI